MIEAVKIRTLPYYIARKKEGPGLENSEIERCLPGHRLLYNRPMRSVPRFWPAKDPR